MPSPESVSQYDVFISHSSHDAVVANALREALESVGIGCWIAPRNIMPGQDWSEAIVAGLTQCRVTVLVFSESSNNSLQVRREIEFSFENRKTVIPWRIADVFPTGSLAYYLNPIHWLNAFPPPIHPYLPTIVNHVQEIFVKENRDTPETTPLPPVAMVVAKETPHNLPREVNSFIGREQERSDIPQLLARGPLVTIAGAGGCGKTRLSLRVAHEMLPLYPEGVWLVELAPLTESPLVAHTIAKTLRITEQPEKTTLEAITEYLRPKKLLLILDNCEHLLTTCSLLVETLMRACPQMTFLVSSREPLGIAGETTYRLPSLSLPDLSRPITTTQLLECEAVRLFVDRATAVDPAFLVTDAMVTPLAQLCVRLDGIPLALELAAVRVRSLSISDICTRLQDRFRLLKGNDRTVLPRQQTLRAMIDWSYNLLSDSEKCLLQKFSLFVGGASLSTVEAVCSDDVIDTWDILDLLTSLVDKSLIFAEQTDEGIRYQMLETIREYAREHLHRNETPDTPQKAILRYSNFYMQFVMDVRQNVAKKEGASYLKKMVIEYDNIRSVLAFCRDQPESGVLGLKMIWLCLIFWISRGYLIEGLSWCQAILCHPGTQEPTRDRVWGLNSAGILSRRVSDFPKAHAFFEEAMAVSDHVGDLPQRERIIAGQAALYWMEGNRNRAAELYEQAVELSRGFEVRDNLAVNLCNLGTIALEQAELEKARQYLDEARPIFESIGDQMNLGVVLHSLTRIARIQGKYEEAKVTLHQCSEIAQTFEYRPLLVHALLQWAYMAEARNDFSRAARLIGAAEGLREQIGETLGPTEMEEFEKAKNSLQLQLTPTVFVEEFQWGKGLKGNEAMSLAWSG